MSKLHRDNAGYVGCSYEETQDPYYSYNKLALPLGLSDKTVLYDEVTFTVTVASGKFVIDGISQATVSLLEGNAYTFDQSDSSNGTHPLKFSYTADGTHGGGKEYTLGVTTNGTPGQSGAYTRIVVPFGLHDLKYYCGNHSGMGGSANVVKNTKAFTVGRPILKTTDAFGKTLGSGNNADPYAANLVLAVPMNGANNGTTFTDVSNVIRGTGSAKTVSAAGDAQTSTAQSFFYGSSAKFDGNDAITINDDGDFDFGSSNICIELWFNLTTVANDKTLVGNYSGNNACQVFIGGSGGNKVGMQLRKSGGSYTDVYSSTSISANRWYHLAAVREGVNIKIYLDGSLENTTNFGPGSVIDSNANMTVGNRTGTTANGITGYISDLRIYKGVAKYTTPFPTGSYGMDVVTYRGNGSTQIIGPIYSAGATATGGFESSNPAANGFNGTLTSGNRANGVTVGGTIEIVFSPGLSVSSTVGIWSGKSGFKYQINDSGSYTSVTNATEQWHDASFSGTLTNLKIQHTASNEAPGFSGIRTDGTTLIDGNGSTLNFQPDFVWTSVRNATGYRKYVFDSVRGPTKALATSHTQGDDTETTLSTSLTAFNSDGFTLGSNSQVNENNKSIVAWGWKAGGAPTTDNVAGAGNVPTAGSAKIDGENMTTSLSGNIPATRLSASTKYGFSIVAYEGNATSGAKVAHGITNATPKMVWFKNRDTDTTDWRVYNTMADGSLDFLFLNTDEVKQDSGLSTFTSTTFTVGSSQETNGNGDSMIAYVFSEVTGYSSLSSYEGAGNAAVSVTTGFKPRWVMIKEVDTAGNWFIYDTQRGTTNILWANTNHSESSIGAGDGTNQNAIEVNDSGFTIPHTLSGTNRNGSTYIYAAFAASASGEGFESVIIDQLGTDDLSGNNNNGSNAGATFQTSVKKFYDGAGDFNGSSSEITVPYSSDFDPGSGDYTVEAWAYWDAGQAGTAISWHGGTMDARWDFGCISAGSLRFLIRNGTTYTVSTTVPTASWLHIAAQRRGNTMELFVNGSPAGTTTISGIWPSASSSGLLIGSRAHTNGNTTFMNGYIQDVRIYKGIAKYTSSFSPPERSVQGTARRYPSGVYVVS